MEHLDILRVDPSLERYKDHFRYRMIRYCDQKKLFDKYEGGLEEFARGNFMSLVGYMENKFYILETIYIYKQKQRIIARTRGNCHENGHKNENLFDSFCRLSEIWI